MIEILLVGWVPGLNELMHKIVGNICLNVFEKGLGIDFGKYISLFTFFIPQRWNGVILDSSWCLSVYLSVHPSICKQGFWNFLRKKLLAQFISYLAFTIAGWVSWLLLIFMFLFLSIVALWHLIFAPKRCFQKFLLHDTPVGKIKLARIFPKNFCRSPACVALTMHSNISVHKVPLCVLVVLKMLCSSTKLTFVLMLSACCVFQVFGCSISVYHLSSHWVCVCLLWVYIVIAHMINFKWFQISTSWIQNNPEYTLAPIRWVIVK